MRWIWIDRILELVPGERLVAIKNISLAEEHLHDHFPADEIEGLPAAPAMPGSLVIEGVAQTAGILVGHAEEFRHKVILAKITKAVLQRDAVPGDTLRYTATIAQSMPQGAVTRGVVELLCPGFEPERIGQVDLVFSHLDNNMGGVQFPEHNFVFGDSFKTVLRTSGVHVD